MAKSAKQDEKPKCLCGECNMPVHCRGLSLVCYQAARRAVVSGDTSWDELIEKDLALPSKAVNETRRAPITRKIRELVATR